MIRKILNNNEFRLIIGSFTNSGYNILIVLLLSFYSKSDYLTYTMFIGLVTFLLPIITFGFGGLIQKDVHKKHSYLLFYLFSPIIFLILTFIFQSPIYMYAVMVNITNISSVYFKSKEMTLKFVIIKVLPLIGFVIFITMNYSIINSFFIANYFSFIFVIFNLIFEGKYKIEFSTYYKVLRNSIKIGLGSYVQGTVVLIEKRLTLLLPLPITIFYNFTTDMATSLKMLKLPFFYSWQIQLFNYDKDFRKILILKNLLINIVISIIICIVILFNDINYFLEFFVFFNLFCMFDLLKDCSYNLWVKKSVNSAFLMNLIYSLMAVLIFSISYLYTPIVVMGRLIINGSFFMITEIFIKNKT